MGCAGPGCRRNERLSTVLATDHSSPARPVSRIADTSQREAPPFELRQARPSNYGFAEQLYFETMRPLLIDLGRWDERRLRARFKRAFRANHVRIIRSNDRDIGWLQISESATEITLNQIHIVAEFRSRGIGTRIIRDLLAHAQDKGLPVVLSVVRNNPALALYQRLGFRIIGEDVEKLHMRWEGPARPG
jgi:ribosomal protein S18 acetylase RimI-like enzyme